MAERISQIIEQTGLTCEAFGLRIGVSKAAVSKWRNGFIGNLKGEHLFKIEDEFGYCARWVAIGQGPVRVTEICEKKPIYSTLTASICVIVESLNDEGKHSVLESAEKAKRIMDLEKEIELLKKA